MKRITSLFLVAAFFVAFAVHPLVHAEDHGGHACLLTTTAPDRASTPVVVQAPVAVFTGRLPAALPTAPVSKAFRLRDARGPPSVFLPL